MSKRERENEREGGSKMPARDRCVRVRKRKNGDISEGWPEAYIRLEKVSLKNSADRCEHEHRLSHIKTRQNKL